MMEAADIEIKTEPLDVDFCVINEEELIIKSEFEDELMDNRPQVCEQELQNIFDTIPSPNDGSYLIPTGGTFMRPETSLNYTPTTSSPNRKFQCDQCGRDFSSARQLADHARLRCRKRNECFVCGQVFRTNLVLQNHLHHHKRKDKNLAQPLRRILPKLGKAQLNPEVVLFACNICSMTFSTGQALKQHNRYHQQYIHFCKKCGKSFKYLIDLKNHTKKIKACADEDAESVLPDSALPDPGITIKDEVASSDSGDEFLTEKMVIGSTVITKIKSPMVKNVAIDPQGNTILIKSEPEAEDPQPQPTQPPVFVKIEPQPTDFIRVESQQQSFLVGSQPTAFIKVEPDDIKEEILSNDSMDYDELILQELIDRKAKSIAKERNALPGSKAPAKKKTFTSIQGLFQDDSLPLENTDFEEVIATNTLAVTKKSEKSVEVEDLYLTVTKEENLDEFSADDSQHSTVQAGLQPAEDFEDMIESNTLVNFQNKVEVIENLRKEYQKANKKKRNNASTDESSQHSSSAGTGNLTLPCSIYLTLLSDPEPYNEATRLLDKKYRYTWVCAWCPRRYLQRFAFTKHLVSKHNKQESDFASHLFELRPEIYRASDVETSYCHVCRVTLADADTLEKHRMEFHKEDSSPKSQFKCDKCGKFCSTRSTLADHVQANCGKEPQHGCEECGKKFHTKSTLNLHKTMHTGELPHQCEFCEKRFRTRGQLTVHTRTHTGERPFPCKVCERRFTHRETLIAHLSRHIDMKRYKCYGCQTFFSCISGLKTHRLTRMSTCGQFKLNARAVGPRVRVIKGNVIFEPQPKINPYYRRHDENENRRRENVNDFIKVEHMSVDKES